MGFTSVTSFNFRNLESGTLRPAEKSVLFIGENGQGKTNYLELLYLLCFGSSFRTRKDSQLIRHGLKEMSASGDISTPGGGSWQVRVVLQDGKKSLFLNGKKVQDRTDLLSLAPCIVFSHDDIGFVNGTPDQRRTFFNQTISICEPAFIDLLRTYRKIIKSRNAALCTGRVDLLDVYDAQLVHTGVELIRRRTETVEEFNGILGPLHREISGLKEDVTVRYRPSWPREKSRKDIEEYLKEKRAGDIERGLTTTGPHRDRFTVTLGSVDFCSTASTGQLRLLSLIYRVVQALRYLSKTKKPPILLLDDVLLELDTTRRIRFLEHLPEYEQAFFTFLPDEQYSRYHFEGKKVYTLVGGNALET